MKIFNNLGLKTRVLLIALIAGSLVCLAYFLNKPRHKILIIGLDGASWNVMEPIIEEGRLPNIKRLMDSGSWGYLKILISPVSETVWTTIATGKSPRSHGITYHIIKDPDSNEMVYPTTNHRRVKAIWNILSEYKKRVGIVGYRVTWPAEKVNGVMISNQADEGNYSSRHNSEPPFTSLFTEGKFNSFKMKTDSPAMLMDNNWALNKDIFMSNISKYLLKNKNFDFFCLYLLGIDIYSHYYWKYMFPEGQNIPPADIAKYKDIIKDYYIRCDDIIGDLLKIVDKNTTVIVISDHGFQTNDKSVKQYYFSRVDYLLEASGANKVSYNSKPVTIQNDPQLWVMNEKNIKITGELSSEEFNRVRENVKILLKNIKVKETGKPIFKILDDSNSGFLFEPDMGYINQHLTGYLLINGKEYKILDFLIVDPDAGGHAENEAVIIMSGKDIRKHQRVTNANIYDIAPTVLYLLDLPVATDMAGKILVRTIDLGILNKKPARYISTYEDNKKITSPRFVHSPEEEKIIKEKLRSLGYIN